jgi:murein DD-endopeptidase MepM/ murein hydrolase activator NlpD
MDGFTNQALAALNGTTLGLGVTYDRQAGYGGMLGIGGDRSNVNIAFSQHGDTTISGSVNTSGGLQLTGSSTTNGSTTVGANYNPSNEGPRRGSNYSLNYDLDNGRLSGSGGYTDTRTGIGFTTNVDSNGLSLSTQYNGNNIATVSGNGFQYDEFNWAQNNINVAQNETGDAERAAKERETLLRRGIRADAIDAMTASDRTELAAAYTRLDENASLLATDSYTREMIDAMTPLQREAALNELHHAVTPDAIAASAMALLGSSAVAFGFMLGGKTNSNTPAGSSSAGQVASNGTKGRRKEGEDVDEDGRPTPPKQPELLPNPMPSPEPKAPEAPSSPGAEPKKIVKRYPLDSAELAKPVSIDRTQYSLTEQGQSDVKKLQERASKLNTKASDSEIADLNKKQAATRAEVQRPLNELRQEIQTLRETIEANRRGQEIGSGISGGSDSANSTSSIQVNPAAEARLNKLRKQEIALTQQVTKELVTLSKQEGVQRAALAEKARLSSLDVLAPNPYRSDVDKLKTQLDNTDKKAGDYTKLKDQYNAIKIKSDAFDSSRDTLLNPKTKPADLGLAAERIKSLNPDAEVPSPTATIVPENRPNRESLAPGYDPKGNVGGVLPGINYPGAIVSNTPLDHSSRGNGTAYHATDIALPHGTPYMPVAEGTAEVINDPKGYGKLVKINHGNGVETLYAHNSEVQVTNGQHVTSTTVIANVGNTGHVGSSYPTEAPWYGGSHIHYELHINEMKVPSQNFDWGRYNTEGQSYVDQYYEQYGPNSPGYNYEVKK